VLASSRPRLPLPLPLPPASPRHRLRVERHLLKGFPRCPYLRRHGAPQASARDRVYRNAAYGNVSPSGRRREIYGRWFTSGRREILFPSVESATADDREKENERGEKSSRLRGRRAVSRSGTSSAARIQLGPKSSFFFGTVDRRLEIIRPFMPIGIRSRRIPQTRGEGDMDKRPIRSLVNSFSRTIRLARDVTRAEIIVGAVAWKTRLSRDKRRKANFGGRRCFILCRVPLARPAFHYSAFTRRFHYSDINV